MAGMPSAAAAVAPPRRTLAPQGWLEEWPGEAWRSLAGAHRQAEQSRRRLKFSVVGLQMSAGRTARSACETPQETTPFALIILRRGTIDVLDADDRFGRGRQGPSPPRLIGSHVLEG